MAGICRRNGRKWSYEDVLALAVAHFVFLRVVPNVLLSTSTHRAHGLSMLAQVDGLLNADRRYRSTWHCFKTIYAQEGGKAFYRGVTTNMLKSFPGIAIVCSPSPPWLGRPFFGVGNGKFSILDYYFTDVLPP